ncbi:hypothetical protein AB1Y20_002241 [Prymnesium parvum]|uniref:Ion transport domain-containing protein n=1 Tax=Prymnesium parvum TaxID=97485 RepID=A0AB34J8J0_PRYPA
MAAVTSRRPSMTAASERSSLRSNESAHTPRPPSCATNGAPRSVVSLSELSAMPHAVQLHDGTPEEMVVLDPVDDDRFTRKLERRTSVVVRADHSATGCARCVVHPHSDLRLAWDLVSALFLLYNMVVVPFRLCFDSFSECPQAAWLFEAVVDWFFVADVVLNFRTGIFLHGDSGAVSTSCREIARKYARTWLSIDVASSVPLDFIVSLSFNGCGGGGTNTSGEEFDALKLLRGLRLAKLLKLLRLLRLSRLLDQLQDHVPINTIVSKARRRRTTTSTRTPSRAPRAARGCTR